MSNTLPKSQAILNYQDIFDSNPPENPLEIISGLCKTTLIGEFAGMNYRLKPKTTMYYDTSLKTQWKLLFHFSGSNENVFNQFRPLYARHIMSEIDYPIIFSRQACLYACEQIINSDMKEIPGFTMAHSWIKLFKYLLAVNSEITKQTNQISEKAQSLEELNPKMLPLNELSIDVNPLYTPYRGYMLMYYFSKHAELGPYFLEYFERTYKIGYDHFVYELLSMYYANNRDRANDIMDPITGEKLDTSWYYSVKSEDQELFNVLSGIYKNLKIERLISVKKFPFFRSVENKYLLIDSVLLMDKCYSQFINDFWFDCIKDIIDEEGKSRFTARYYRAQVGVFFEKYTGDILRYSFNSKDFVLKTFSELKIKDKKDEKEITDIYLRYKKQVFVAEVKSTGLYDEEKYSGEVNQLYKYDRERFFSSFGVDQIVQCIANLNQTIPTIDPSFPTNRRCHISPAIIVNEKSMQTPFMANIFNERFKELMAEVRIDSFAIHPLSLIHISDLENMEDFLHAKPRDFWNILRYHLRLPAFIPPFYNSLNRRNVKPNFKKSRQLFEELVLKYQRTKPSSPN